MQPMVVPTGAFVTPQMQQTTLKASGPAPSAPAAAATSVPPEPDVVAAPAVKPAGPPFMSAPPVDPDRTLPSNFDQSLADLYKRLPDAALPKGPCAGKFNFTVFVGDGNRIEVQLSSRACFCKKSRKTPVVASFKPLVPFHKYATVSIAWKAALANLGVAEESQVQA
mmetsp:Transcript_65716/g.137373  ORF Transcript_65716/g.137373 Transcript_65716/m.137373 type:complete len:167 (+) Transcript_65716:715-1215(+)